MPNYFEVPGVKPRLGRLFEGTGAVISYRLWQSRFEGLPDAVGKTLKINRKPVTIEGIAPKGFVGASPMTCAADLWLPTTSHSGRDGAPIPNTTADAAG